MVDVLGVSFLVPSRLYKPDMYGNMRRVTNSESESNAETVAELATGDDDYDHDHDQEDNYEDDNEDNNDDGNDNDAEQSELVPTFSLSLTQSVGHHNYTGFNPEIAEIPFSHLDEVQILIASDGLFDIIQTDPPSEDMTFLGDVTNDATAIAEFAERRWRQDWKYIPDEKEPEEFSVTQFPAYDDIAVGVWSYKP